MTRVGSSAGAQYRKYETSPAVPTEDNPQPSTKMLALSPLAFPTIITSYGLAAFILINAAVPPEQDIEVYKVFIEVMVLNLVALLFARPIIKYLSTVLTILGAVLGVLQVALAVQMIILAMRMLRILSLAKHYILAVTLIYGHSIIIEIFLTIEESQVPEIVYVSNRSFAHFEKIYL